MSVKVNWSDRLEALAEKLFSDWEQRSDIITRHLRQFCESRTPEEALKHLNDFRVLCVERHGAFGINRVNDYMVRKLAGSVRNPQCPIPVMITRTKNKVFLFGSDKAVEKSCTSVVDRKTGFIIEGE